MKSERSSIESVFAPKSVALIGATETPGSVGRALAENLRSFKGRLHFTNPNKGLVLDLPTVASIERLCRRIVGHIASGNTGMKRVSEEVGFTLQGDANGWRAEIRL